MTRAVPKRDCPAVHRSRGIAALVIAIVALSACAARPQMDLTEASASTVRERIRAGDWSAVAVAQAHLQVIRDLDESYRAVIATAPDVMAEAQAIDAKVGAGQPTGALAGIPVLIKDNIETRDLPTTAGSLALAGNATGRDAPLVQRLRDADAVVLGKTNLTEWANFRSDRASSGWSGVGGQTRNAVDPTRSPCGSSSGSAVAVALGMATLAVGTETNGSVVCPASANGIVGFKPTVGLVNTDGIIPISTSQDTAGPMTRSVADARLLLQAMLDPDAASDLGVNFDKVAPKAELQGLRIGVLRSATGYHEGVDALFEQSLARLENAGVVLVDDLRLTPPESLGDDTYTILLYEFRSAMDDWLASLTGPLAGIGLADLVAFNRAHATEELLWFGQEHFERALEVEGVSDPTYKAALARAQSATRADGLDRLLSEHDVSAVIAPTFGPPWTIDLINGDHFGGGFSTYPAVSGYPHLTLPMGTLHGLPIGLSITAGKGRDPHVLAIGQAFEALAVRDSRYPVW